VQVSFEEIQFPSTIWAFSIIFKAIDFNLSGHHVISLLEQSGTLRASIGLLLIYHQTHTKINEK